VVRGTDFGCAAGQHEYASNETQIRKQHALSAEATGRGDRVAAVDDGESQDEDTDDDDAEIDRMAAFRRRERGRFKAVGT
jgi:hypothetical protein